MARSTAALTSLVLTGFMGTGKTTVGRLLALRSALRWVDTDELITERYGSIPALFARAGETRFRQYEAALCRELAAQDGLLISTGGGTLLRPERAAIFSGRALIICLTAQAETIASRLSRQDGTRPLFGADWRGLLAQRAPAYRAFPNQVATDGRSAEQVADEVWQRWLAARSA